ncbi:hypothetical protein B1J92_J01958g [Nakaseomyces glabratus]|nr:hypothetical protein B1J91_J01958g [Nakaseomyces glabratus]OXB47239.1 hypothetical protein B1J92_J01958g [Nakaseomyces glabratus]
MIPAIPARPQRKKGDSGEDSPVPEVPQRPMRHSTTEEIADLVSNTTKELEEMEQLISHGHKGEESVVPQRRPKVVKAKEHENKQVVDTPEMPSIPQRPRRKQTSESLESVSVADGQGSKATEEMTATDSPMEDKDTNMVENTADVSKAKESTELNVPGGTEETFTTEDPLPATTGSHPEAIKETSDELNEVVAGTEKPIEHTISNDKEETTLMKTSEQRDEEMKETKSNRASEKLSDNTSENETVKTSDFVAKTAEKTAEMVSPQESRDEIEKSVAKTDEETDDKQIEEQKIESIEESIPESIEVPMKKSTEEPEKEPVEDSSEKLVKGQTEEPSEKSVSSSPDQSNDAPKTSTESANEIQRKSQEPTTETTSETSEKSTKDSTEPSEKVSQDRSDQNETADGEETKPHVPESRPKKRGPPPVPKKPSSRIAAFQEMLQKQQEAQFEKSQKKGEQNDGAMNSDARTKFANNLNGLFALPGMVPGGPPPPALAKVLKDPQDTANDKTSTSNDQDTGSGTNLKDVRHGRARGPRGRKLPTKVATTEKVKVSETGNTIEIFSAWKLSIKGQVVHDADDDIDCRDQDNYVETEEQNMEEQEEREMEKELMASESTVEEEETVEQEKTVEEEKPVKEELTVKEEQTKSAEPVLVNVPTGTSSDILDNEPTKTTLDVQEPSPEQKLDTEAREESGTLPTEAEPLDNE